MFDNTSLFQKRSARLPLVASRRMRTSSPGCDACFVPDLDDQFEMVVGGVGDVRPDLHLSAKIGAV